MNMASHTVNTKHVLLLQDCMFLDTLKVDFFLKTNYTYSNMYDTSVWMS